MKKLILSAAVVMLTAMVAKAQDSFYPEPKLEPTSVATTATLFSESSDVDETELLRNSIYAGWGFMPLTDFGSLFSSTIAGMLTPLAGYSFDTYKSDWSSLFAGYERYVTSWLAVGADFTYSHSTSIYTFDDESANRPNINVSVWWATVMINAKIVWWHNPMLKIYSRGAIGVSLVGYNNIEDANGARVRAVDGDPSIAPYFGLQASLFGIEYGRKIAVFCEPVLTTGWQGTLLTLGLKINF